MDEDDTRKGQVIFVGSKGSGKSSLYQCLKYPHPHVIDVPSSNVLVEEWKPFDLETSPVAEECRKYIDQSLSEEELKSTVQVWDICGRESLWACQQLCISKEALFVLVLNVRNPMDAKQVPQWVQMIQAKSIGAHIIIAASNCEVYDSGSCEDVLTKIEKLESTVLGEIQEEIKTLEKLKSNAWVRNRIAKLEEISKNRPKFSPSVILTSAVTGKGLSELRCAVLQRIFNHSGSPHFQHKLNSNEMGLLTKVHNCHSGKGIVMSMKEYDEVASSVGLADQCECEKATEALEMKGYLARVNVAAPFHHLDTTIVIADPCCFARACALIHRDEENPQDFVNKFQKSQLIERFWPTSTRPNDWTLRSAVDDVVSKGMMRESFLPLCWQVWEVDEDDIKQLLNVLLNLGVLVDGAPKASYEIELTLSYFKNLSVTTRYHLPLLMKLPQKIAEGVWPNKVPDSTVSVGWQYKFQEGVSEGLIFCILAACKNYKPGKVVLAHWQYGLVAHLGHVDMCIMSKDRSLYFSARCKITNGNKQALTMAWVTMAHFLYVTETFLSNFPGLYYQVLSSFNVHRSPKSVYHYIEECFTGINDRHKSLWILPPSDFDPGDNTELSVLAWVRHLSGQSCIYISAAPGDEIKLLASQLEQFGFNILLSQHFTTPHERLAAIPKCTLVILFLTKSYVEDASLQEDFNQAQSSSRPVIAARFHLDINQDFSNAVLVDLNAGTGTGLSYTFDKDQLGNLISQCCTLAYGSGNIDSLSTDTEEHKTEMSTEPTITASITPKSCSNDKQVIKPEKKKKVQFSDAHNNNTSQFTDEQIKPLAACTVAAAMVGAAAKHVSGNRKANSAGGRAANATAKVARAVVAGDADDAIKAMNEVVKIVDDVTSLSHQENGFRNLPKSKTCVIV